VLQVDLTWASTGAPNSVAVWFPSRFARRRPVPIHPELVRLGFLEYVEQQRTEP
jgi:hypothetical protein